MDKYELHDFHFNFLPSLLKEDNDVNALRSFASLSSELRMSGRVYDLYFMSITHEMILCSEYFLLTFPLILESDVLFSIVVISKDKKILYFTLEKESITKYFFCQIDIMYVHNSHKVISEYAPTMSYGIIDLEKAKLDFKEMVFTHINRNLQTLNIEKCDDGIEKKIKRSRFQHPCSIKDSIYYLNKILSDESYE